MQRDRVAGVALAAAGVGTALIARTYGLGTPTTMGAGFFPFCLGLILAVLGLLVTLAPEPQEVSTPGDMFISRVDLRGWGCILAGMMVFMALGRSVGIIAAAFCCVFVAALGDRSTSWRERFGLAIGVTIFGVIVFHYLLGIQLPLVVGYYG